MINLILEIFKIFFSGIQLFFWQYQINNSCILIKIPSVSSKKNEIMNTWKILVFVVAFNFSITIFPMKSMQA